MSFSYTNRPQYTREVAHDPEAKEKIKLSAHTKRPTLKKGARQDSSE